MLPLPPRGAQRRWQRSTFAFQFMKAIPPIYRQAVTPSPTPAFFNPNCSLPQCSKFLLGAFCCQAPLLSSSPHTKLQLQRAAGVGRRPPHERHPTNTCGTFLSPHRNPMSSCNCHHIMPATAIDQSDKYASPAKGREPPTVHHVMTLGDHMILSHVKG